MAGLHDTLPLDAHVDADLDLRPDDVQARLHALNLAAWLRRSSLADLAALVGALQAECVCRGIQVAAPLGEAQARIEAHAAAAEPVSLGGM